MEVIGRLPNPVAAVIEEFQTENVPLLAASIAYNAFVSLLPLFLLLVVVVAAIGNESLTDGIIDLTEGVLAPGMQGQLAEALEDASSRAGASIIGVVTLLWGALKIFRGIDTAFSEIYDSHGQDSFVDQLTDGLIVLACLGLAIMAAVTAGAVFTVFEQVPFIGLLMPVLLVVGLTIAFFPVYYVFPDVDLSVTEVVPGVVIAAIGWVALESLFQVYVSMADKQDAAGIIGGVVLLLTWLYFSSLVLLVGAVVNAVLAGRTGAPAIDEAGSDEPAAGRADETPEPHAVAESSEADAVPRREYERVRDRYRRLERDYAELARAHGDLKRANARLESKRLDEPAMRVTVDGDAAGDLAVAAGCDVCGHDESYVDEADAVRCARCDAIQHA